MLRRQCLLAGIVSALCLGAGIARARADLPFEKIIPSDALYFAKYEDVRDFNEKLRQTQFGQMLRDPMMKPFVDEASQQFAALMEQFGNQIRGMSELQSGRGQYATGVMAAPGQFPPVRNFYLFEVDDREGETDRQLEALSGIFEQMGAMKRLDGDRVIYEIETPGGPITVFCYQTVGGVVIMSNAVDEVVRFSSYVEKGAPKPVAELPAYKAFRETVGDPDLAMFVNVSQILDFVRTQAGPQVGGVMNLIGLNAFESIGFSLSLDTEEYATISRFIIRKEGDSIIANLFNMPQTDLTPQKWVPATVASYFTISWNYGLFCKSALSLAAIGGSQPVDQLRKVLAGPDPQHPLFELERDFINPLGNRLTLLRDGQPIDKQVLGPILFAWELKDAGHVKELLAKSAKMVDGAVPLDLKEIDGETIYTIPVGEVLRQEVQGPLASGIPVGDVAIGVVEGNLMITTHVEFLERVMKGGNGLAQSPTYRKIAARFPEKTSALGYSNGVDRIRPLWTLLKGGMLSDLVTLGVDSNPGFAMLNVNWGPFIGSLRGENLPEFDEIKGYFENTGSYIIMDSTGLEIISFSPKREK